ncbi:MAG: hypothetical protein HZC55_24150 [Verrucomicrobia bacterium]|nr:hypothetical protein [Verrucomicrobiota bacterium]
MPIQNVGRATLPTEARLDPARFGSRKYCSGTAARIHTLGSGCIVRRWDLVPPWSTRENRCGEDARSSNTR